jgi:hypothetical protein
MQARYYLILITLFYIIYLLIENNRSTKEILKRINNQ